MQRTAIEDAQRVRSSTTASVRTVELRERLLVGVHRQLQGVLYLLGLVKPEVLYLLGSVKPGVLYLPAR